MPFGRACVRMGFFEEEMVLKGLSILLGAPSVSLTGVSVSLDVLELIPREMAERHRIIPIGVTPGVGREGTLLMALSSPKRIIVMDELAFMTGHRISPVLALDFEIDAALLRLYGVEVDAHTRNSTMVDLDIDDGIAAGDSIDLDLDLDATRHVHDFLPTIDLSAKPKR